MTRKLTAVSAAISVIACLAACSAAAGAVTDDSMPEYRCRFARNAWKADDWIMVKSPRWSYSGKWIQRDDHILNATPADASRQDLLSARAAETYTSMVLKEKVAGAATITSTMSFDDQMAPLIVLADSLGDDGNGRREYRSHTEIVLFDGGINIWQHHYRDGKPSWVRLAWSSFRLKPGIRHQVKVTVAGKQIEVTAAGHTIGCTNPDLPESYYVGITGCEGKNRFYDFSVKSAIP